MNNAIFNAAQQFTAAKGGAFAAVAVRVEASHATVATTPPLWRMRDRTPMLGINHEPLSRPVCSVRRG